MARLEAEVLSYPGFKSTPAVISAFEVRSLPRAYLILLENLLTPIPSSRPTCEKVLGALREGKVGAISFLHCRVLTVCQLDPVRSRSRASPPSTSLMPVVKRHSSPDATIDRTPTPTPTLQVESTPHADLPTSQESSVETVDEKTSLMSLPAPEEQHPIYYPTRRGLLRFKLMVRTIKSGILVMKVSLCIAPSHCGHIDNFR